jgi:hypothetical protein
MTFKCQWGRKPSLHNHKHKLLNYKKHLLSNICKKCTQWLKSCGFETISVVCDSEQFVMMAH